MSNTRDDQQYPFSDLHEAVLEGMARGVAQSIETHRRQGQPIVGMRDGRIVWVAPEQIAPRPLPGDDEPLPEDIEI